MVICLKRSANDLHMIRLMPLPPRHLCFSKIQNGLSVWYRPTQVVLEKRPLKTTVCVCSREFQMTAQETVKSSTKNSSCLVDENLVIDKEQDYLLGNMDRAVLM